MTYLKTISCIKLLNKMWWQKKHFTTKTQKCKTWRILFVSNDLVEDPGLHEGVDEAGALSEGTFSGGDLF